jgi:hypothetical protein
MKIDQTAVFILLLAREYQNKINKPGFIIFLDKYISSY